MYFPFQPVFVQPVFSAVHGPNKLKPANGSGGSKLANFWLFTFACSCKDPSVDLRSRSLRLPRPTSMEWSKTNKANRNFAWQSPQRSMARNELGKRRTNSRPHVYNPSWIWHRSARNAALALRKTCEFWHQVKTKNRNLVAWHWLEYLHKFSPQVWTTFHFCSFRFVAQWVSNHARVHIFALFSKRQQWNKWTTPVGHQLLFGSRSCSQICSFVFTLSNTCENSGDKGQRVHRFYLCNLLLKPQSFVSQIRTPKSKINNPKPKNHPTSQIWNLKKFQTLRSNCKTTHIEAAMESHLFSKRGMHCWSKPGFGFGLSEWKGRPTVVQRIFAQEKKTGWHITWYENHIGWDTWT